MRRDRNGCPICRWPGGHFVLWFYTRAFMRCTQALIRATRTIANLLHPTP
jgi:hypothetical protein